MLQDLHEPWISWNCSRIALWTIFFFVCVRSLDIWKRTEGWFLSRLERWRAETDSGFLALSINVNLIATVVKWSHEWNFSVVYIKPAVMNQSAPNQKDQFLLSFIFRPAMQFVIFRYMFCWTGISLFYCLKKDLFQCQFPRWYFVWKGQDTE